MRWSYKTVHYELKKEGLLGSAFLDESEVEQSLNEYGKAGWELVSILETQDGLIAVFKQPLAARDAMHAVDEAHDRPHVSPPSKKENFTRQPDLLRGGNDRPSRTVPPAVPIEEYEIVADDQEEEEKQAPKTQDDVGAIRIE